MSSDNGDEAYRFARIDDPFKDDCASWRSYKPCAVQGVTGLASCASCDQYRPAEPQILFPSRPRFDSSVYSWARRVGIVEMGGLGSVLRTTAVSHAVSRVSRAAIYWFTHTRGAEVLRHVPGVIPVDVESGPFPWELIHELDVTLNFEQNSTARAIVAHSKVVGGFDLNPQLKFRPASEHARYFQQMQIDNAARRDNRKTMQRMLLEAVGLGDHRPRYYFTLPQTHRQLSRELLLSFRSNAGITS